jgi:predicted Zn-dependent protease
MEKINWLEKLGWGEDQLEDLRFTGYAYTRQGKYDIALDFFKALVILDPENIYDAQMLGAIYVELDQPEEAIKALENALKLDGDHTPALINLCKALFMSGRVNEGIKLAKILQKDKDSAIASNARALILAFAPPKKKKKKSL